MFQIKKNKYLNILLWIFIIIPGVPFILGSLAFLVYAHWPRNFSDLTEITIKNNVEYVTISAHGVKDDSNSWSDELQALMSASPYQQLENIHQKNISLDWRPYSDNVFICSVAGKNIGYEIGREIAKNHSVKGIHTIGHSCGAFVTLGICEGAKSIRSNIKIQTTYLDPVSVYSGIFWKYGINTFGTCADFSDTYIDTEDTVTGSNQVLPYSYTTDVTKIRIDEKLQYPPHVWPTIFYNRAYKNQQVPLLYNTKKNVQNEFKYGRLLKKIKIQE